MKAALMTGVGGVEVHDVDEPTLDPAGALLRVEACGICEPPASTIGTPDVAATSFANRSPDPGQFVLTMSAPNSAHSRTFRAR